MCVTTVAWAYLGLTDTLLTKSKRHHIDMHAVAQLLHQLEDAQLALADLCGLLLLSGRPALTHARREAGLSLGERTRLVNALHLTLASLRTQAWFEWVPSKENIADVPSREDSDLELIEILEGAGLEGAFDEVEFLFPPMQAWTAPLGIFAAAP